MEWNNKIDSWSNPYLLLSRRGGLLLAYRRCVGFLQRQHKLTCFGSRRHSEERQVSEPGPSPEIVHKEGEGEGLT
jgi:hypothetical protein